MPYKRKFVNKSGISSPISGANSNAGAWNNGSNAPMNNSDGFSNTDWSYRNYMSRLPEVYTGHPNRIERYNQYEMMDVDAEVNACLDIISEFSTQKNEHNGTPFNLEYKDKPTPHELKILQEQLQQWCKLNQFDQRVFKIFRNVVKYGDQVFVRDPENFKLYWVDMVKVIKVIVNESEGKNPEQYVIKDLNINLQNLTVAQKTNTDFAANPATGLGGTGGGTNTPYTVPAMPYNTSGSRFTLGQSESAIDAKHVLHLSLTEGLDRFWPFGQSILENIFKVYKQKELLEDAVLIYRVQRAPERRLFKIDVGNMPSHMAMAFVERVKNEIHQRRIPSIYGGQSVVDASYNPLCLDLDTRIPLLDGRTLSLRDIISEFENGKENWTYSCNPVTGKVVPGVINWAGVTRKNTEVIELTFDNGKTLVCTPDHKLVHRMGGFIEAKDSLNESIMPFNSKLSTLKSNYDKEYMTYYDTSQQKWIPVHRMVAEFFRTLNKHQEFTFLPENVNKEKNTVHHKDYNRFNNNPSNLQWMHSIDHFKFHSANNFWINLTGKNLLNAREKYSRMMSERNKTLWSNSGYVHMMSTLRKNLWNDPEYIKTTASGRDDYLNKFSRYSWSTKMLDMILLEYKRTNSSVKVLENLNKSTEFIKLYNDGIQNTYQEHTRVILYRKHLYKVLKHFGYSGFNTEFKNLVTNFNHRVVKITKLDNRDTGTITIDGYHKWHDYHTFAIESGIFVKNSMNEDYFFPVTADGRGSSVEVMPGGQNLGEIDDLRYFNNRLARGLRVPSSYLPTGPDDSDRPLSDGRVGTALIQEYRFNQYCERLQNYISLTLDQEFKLFLRWRGFNIDSGLFQLEFNAPQNFAAYRQSELDTARVGTFQAMEAFPYISKRFAMERFLGLSEEEISKNEKLWREENGKEVVEEPKGSDLRSVGVSPSDIEMDMEAGEDLEDAPEEGEGLETAGPVGSEMPGQAGTAPGGEASASGGAAAGPAPAGPAA
jgi:hypothetical protein